MDFRSNEDYYYRDRIGYARGVSYNQVIDVLFIEGSGDVTEPLTDAQYCDFAKIDSAMAAADADMVHIIAVGARDLCEKYTNISFVPRTIRAVVNNGNGGVHLPYGPVADVTEVQGFNSQILTTEQYKIDGVQWKQLMYPCEDRVTVTYTAGYDTLPAGIKLGLLQAFFYLWDNRSVAVDNIGEVAMKTLNKYRRV